MSPIDWYYAQSGKQLGPVSPAELKQLVLSGQLKPDELVWREGMPDWTPARNVKGLFTDDAPSSEEVETAPLAVPPVAPTPTTPRRHLFDIGLNFAKRTITPRFIDATTLLFTQIGHYGLYCAMTLVVLVAIGVNTRMLPLAIAVVPILFVLQYTAGRLTAPLNKLNQTVTGTISTNVFFECLAIFSMVYSLILLVSMSILAAHVSSLQFALGTLFVYIVLQFLAFLMLNPKSLGITVDAYASPTETSIGLMTMVLKLCLKLTPVAFGAGITAGTLSLFSTMFFAADQSPAALIAALGSTEYIIFFAALPAIVYIAFLLLHLGVRFIHSVVSLSQE